MNVIEFVGFIAMLLFLLHSARNKRRRQEEQSGELDTEESEQAQRLKEFLQGIDSDMKPEPVHRQPQRQNLSVGKAPKPKKEVQAWEHSSAKQQKKAVNKPYAPHVEAHYAPRETAYSIAQQPYKDPYAVKKDAYELTEKRKSGAYYLKKRLKSSGDMILWQEIIGPPKALRNDRF